MNYSKMRLQFICKMAMSFAFVFAACSEDPVAGGVTEETRVYALAGQVGDVYPKLLKVADQGSPTDSSGYEGSVFAAKGTIVTVHELDSLTLEKTGRSFVDTVDNDDGRFAFENLSLNSPYVMIETLDSCYTEDCRERGVFFGENSRYSYCEDSLFAGTGTCSRKYSNVLNAVVDLRNVKKVSVSSLTTSKIPLMQKYFAEGKSFAGAGDMAEREILENLGIYEDLGRFENLNGEKSELAYVNELIRMNEFDMRYDLLKIAPMLVYAAPSKLFIGRGEVQEQYYLNSRKMIDYEVGFLARVDSLGQCTDARENADAEIKVMSDKAAVVCRSGKWTLGFKTVEHTMGSMMDKRDGKSYKTVTYNWGDVSQTWMAENLNFVDTMSLSIDSSLRTNLSGNVYCYRENLDDANCSIYGHEYQWKAAMNIGDADIKMYSVDALGDTTYFVKECVDTYNRYIKSEDSMYETDPCDTLYLKRDSDGRIAEFLTWNWNYADYITPANQNAYQGVCPDGWRIPTWNDWETLLQNMAEQYGVERNKVLPALYDAVATGFDLKGWVNARFAEEIRYVLLSGFMYTNAFILADVPLYVLEMFNTRDFGFSFGMSAMHGFVERVENGAYDNSPYAPYKSAAVRCIKK